MGQRWRRRFRRDTPGAERGQDADAAGRCPDARDAEPVVVDLIDLTRPPLKLVPLENLLPPVAVSEPEAGATEVTRSSGDTPRSAG